MVLMPIMAINNLKGEFKMKVWFITGSQDLYGDETLEKVGKQVKEILNYMNNSKKLSVELENKCIAKSSEEITDIMIKASNDSECIGVITWMHTFSPSKMWINGLKELKKPLLHFHTQYHSAIPLNEIDMKFMNLNQSAHGDREHGHILSLMGIRHKIIHGFWQDDRTLTRINNWLNLCKAIRFSKNLKVARFGDNMRDVAVTEGNKVNAQMTFGWSINTYGVGDLVDYVNKVSDSEIDKQMASYEKDYTINSTNIESIRYQAKLNVAMRKFLQDKKCMAFTDTFQDLHGLKQLPGLASQQLMSEGYGFGGEGDWKTSAMVAILKVLNPNNPSSFMEDYTYHIPNNADGLVLGSHMLEVCPSIANGDKPKIEVHDLSIGDREAPARLVFNGKTGKAWQLSLIEFNGRYRLIANACSAVELVGEMPNLPVARVMWKLEPSLEMASEAWLLAGGAHHTVMTYGLELETLQDFADYFDIELVLIDNSLNLANFKRDLELNNLLYKFK